MAKRQPKNFGTTQGASDFLTEYDDIPQELKPEAPSAVVSRLDVMNKAFADLTLAIAELGDLDDLVKYGGATVRPVFEAAQYGSVASLLSGGSEELTLLAQRIRQLTNSIHSNLF